jgi:hypothetical protein
MVLWVTSRAVKIAVNGKFLHWGWAEVVLAWLAENGAVGGPRRGGRRHLRATSETTKTTGVEATCRWVRANGHAPLAPVAAALEAKPGGSCAAVAPPAP